MLNRRVLLSVGWLLLLVACRLPQSHSEAKELAKLRFDHQKANMKYLLAVEQFDNSQIKKAKVSIQEALGLYTEAPEYYLLMAKIFIEQGELVSAKETLRYIVYQGEPQAEYYYLSGLLAERYSNLEEACSHYRQAHKLDRLNIAHVMAYAETLAQLNRYQDALQLIENRIHDFDGEGRLYALRGEIFQALGRYSEAAEAYASALIQYPEDPLLLESRAVALYWAGSYVKAIPAMRELINTLGKTTPRHLLHALTRCYMEIGDYTTAESYLKEMTKTASEDVQAWIKLAECEIVLNDYNAALKSAQRAVKLAPEKAGTQLTLGFIYWCQENWIKARRALEAAVRVDPADYTALSLLGKVSEGTGRQERALGYYRRALQLDPGDMLAGYLFAQLYQANTEEVQMSLDPRELKR